MFKLTRKPKPLVLCILDGWGVAPDSPGNAITQAHPAFLNSLWHSYPHTLLLNSGKAVGLPEGMVGNSEVGHLNLGAGFIIYQDVLRINLAIADGTFFQNEVLLKTIEHAKRNNSSIHFMGLVSQASVHSHLGHLYVLLEFCQKNGFDTKKVNVHVFTDGRDSPPTSAAKIVASLEDYLKKHDFKPIASISGRYYAMDRDNRWERTAKAYFALVGNSALKNASALEVVDSSYKNGITDEFINPTIIVDSGKKPIGSVKNNDAVIFFNYRQDRARQLTKAFVLENLDNIKTSSGQETTTFERGPKLKNIFFATMTQYEIGLPVSGILFKQKEVTMPLARVLAERGMRQLHLAETEKYAHVTYFFNGGKEAPFKGEDRILINSQKVASYDQAPEMSAPEITNQLLTRLAGGNYDFIVLNYANADMVAHTGDLKATISAIRCLDSQLSTITKAILAAGGGLIITSDHGNAEVMINPKTGQVDTEHNNNPTPCLLILPELRNKNIQLRHGVLADIAPTILAILGITQPSSMTGRNLLT